MPGAPLAQREAEKALRGVAGRRVVVVDVRPGPNGEDVDIERLVVQLALKSHEGALVLLAPHDERSRSRVRTLCERHAVDAWLASGPDAFVQSIPACDLFVGRPSWRVALASMHRVAVAALAVDGKRGLVDALRAVRPGPTAGSAVVDDVASTLQLAAAIDRRLADPGSLDTRGIGLREALFGARRGSSSTRCPPSSRCRRAPRPPPSGSPSVPTRPTPRARPVVWKRAIPLRLPPRGHSPRAKRSKTNLHALRQKMAGGT